MRPAPRPARLLLLAGLALHAGCDTLRASPGGDFAVSLSGPSPIVATGRIAVPVQGRVAGCDAFAVAVSSPSGSHRIDAALLGGGAFAAQVPVEWLRGAGGDCAADGSAPEELRAHLVVTCLDAGRSASAELAVRYAAATRTASFFLGLDQPVVRAIFPGSDPLSPLVLAPTSNGAVYIPDYGRYAYESHPRRYQPLATPRAVWSTAEAFVTVGCASSEGCASVVVSADVTVPGARLLGLRPEGGWYSTSEAHVPDGVVDLAFADDGALLVLSQVGDSFAHSVLATVVVRVAPDVVEYAHRVSVVGYFPGERVETRFSRDASGRLAFITSADIGVSQIVLRTALRLTDGHTLEERLDPTSLLGEWRAWPDRWRDLVDPVFLSPDARLVAAQGRAIGPVGGPLASVPSLADPFAYYRGFSNWAGVAWTSDGAAFWGGLPLGTTSDAADTGQLELFDLAPPHARRFGYEVQALPGVTQQVELHGVAAVDDRLVLTTSTGVRVLSRDGRLIGGADPLPCGLAPTSLAVQTGPHHAAVGAGPYLYVFDLSTMDDAVTAAP